MNGESRPSRGSPVVGSHPPAEAAAAAAAATPTPTELSASVWWRKSKRSKVWEFCSVPAASNQPASLQPVRPPPTTNIGGGGGDCGLARAERAEGGSLLGFLPRLPDLGRRRRPPPAPPLQSGRSRRKSYVPLRAASAADGDERFMNERANERATPNGWMRKN